MDVAVAHRGHGDDGPVEGGGHRVEHRPLLVLLPDVGQPAEDQHPHDDHQHQEAQLFITKTIKNCEFPSLLVHLQPVLQCHSQGLETGYMTGKLKNPKKIYISVQVNFPFSVERQNFQ